MISHDSDKMGELHRELHSVLPSKRALRVKALESALVAKGLLAPDTVDKWLENYSEKIGPKKISLGDCKILARPGFQEAPRAGRHQDI
jgi:nitrile hydratase subunit alpha